MSTLNPLLVEPSIEIFPQSEPPITITVAPPRDTDEAERVRWLREVLAGAGIEPRALRHEEGARKVKALCARPQDWGIYHSSITRNDVQAPVR